MVELSQLPWLSLLAAAIVSAAGTFVFSQFATAVGLVDHPGGRKAHLSAIPLVGGLAILLALIATAWFAGIARATAPFLGALAIVAAVGLWDDLAEISPRLKLAIQVAAACLMIWGAQVQLESVGNLLGWRSIGLSFLSIPFTVFAVVGVINAVNMMDGLDGLAGTIALVAFAWYAAVAAGSGLDIQFAIALAFTGAIAGFLPFNLRFPWQPQARVFLGDAGSLMIGFALGWFAIDLTQGPGRTFPPIAALWVIVLPLSDCVSLMSRRLRARKSPFDADRHHIHHYLLARGLTHSQTLGVLVALTTLFGAIGYFGWRWGVPESWMFWPFFFGFFSFHFWIKREWTRLEGRR